MKKKVKNYILSIILLFLVGCEGSVRHNYHEYYHHDSDELSKRKGQPEGSRDRSVPSKEYCTYYLSYFIPLNFWNFRFTDRQYIKRAIEDFNENGIKGNNMKNIYCDATSLGTPIFSFSCVEITGEVYE